VKIIIGWESSQTLLAIILEPQILTICNFYMIRQSSLKQVSGMPVPVKTILTFAAAIRTSPICKAYDLELYQFHCTVERGSLHHCLLVIFLALSAHCVYQLFTDCRLCHGLALLDIFGATGLSADTCSSGSVFMMTWLVRLLRLDRPRFHEHPQPE
jgi:hypothetical protein